MFYVVRQNTLRHCSLGAVKGKIFVAICCVGFIDEFQKKILAWSASLAKDNQIFCYKRGMFAGDASRHLIFYKKLQKYLFSVSPYNLIMRLDFLCKDLFLYVIAYHKKKKVIPTTY